MAYGWETSIWNPIVIFVRFILKCGTSGIRRKVASHQNEECWMCVRIRFCEISVNHWLWIVQCKVWFLPKIFKNPLFQSKRTSPLQNVHPKFWGQRHPLQVIEMRNAECVWCLSFVEAVASEILQVINCEKWNAKCGGGWFFGKYLANYENYNKPSYFMKQKFYKQIIIELCLQSLAFFFPKHKMVV